MNKTEITELDAKELIKGKLSRYFGVAPSEASKEQLYKAVVMSVRDIMLEKRQKFHIETKAKKAKRVYYLCMEFLMGRSLKNSVFNLGVKEAFDRKRRQAAFFRLRIGGAGRERSPINIAVLPAERHRPRKLNAFAPAVPKFIRTWKR